MRPWQRTQRLRRQPSGFRQGSSAAPPCWTTLSCWRSWHGGGRAPGWPRQTFKSGRLRRDVWAHGAGPAPRTGAGAVPRGPHPSSALAVRRAAGPVCPPLRCRASAATARGAAGAAVANEAAQPSRRRAAAAPLLWTGQRRLLGAARPPSPCGGVRALSLLPPLLHRRRHRRRAGPARRHRGSRRRPIRGSPAGLGLQLEALHCSRWWGPRLGRDFSLPAVGRCRCHCAPRCGRVSWQGVGHSWAGGC
mmetsp:Transcript_62362/g.201094  ORF Transcript_62362/g.201094 Transcript_62362/m.201094 type:complete len:248 (-) Transcript_62362:2082-2825(-)